jgi:hypothetical protein
MLWLEVILLILLEQATLSCDALRCRVQLCSYRWIKALSSSLINDFDTRTPHELNLALKESEQVSIFKEALQELYLAL